MHHSRLKLSISFYLVHIWSALSSFAFLSDDDDKLEKDGWRATEMAGEPWYYEEFERGTFIQPFPLQAKERFKCHLQLSNGWLKERQDQTFLRGAQLQQIKVRQGKFWLSSYKEKILHKECAASEHVPRQVVEQPSLEILKAQPDTALSYLYQIQIAEADPTVSRRWDQMTSRGKVLSHLNSSMILMCSITCVLRY